MLVSPVCQFAIVIFKYQSKAHFEFEDNNDLDLLEILMADD